MADEKDSETFFDEPEQSADSGKDEKAEEQPESQVEEGEVVEEQSFLKGTSFKSGEELAKAYKELQGHSTRRNQEFAKLQDILEKVLPTLSRKQQTEIEEDPDEFMKKFVSNPRATLLSLVNDAQKGFLKSELEPLRGEVRGMSASAELDRFLSKHPELSDEDIPSFMQVMDAFPEIRSRKDRLETWFKLLRIEHPEIGERTTKQKESLERSASDAKTAAGLGGKKSSTPRKPEGDEFDDVLDLWKTKQDKLDFKAKSK